MASEKNQPLSESHSINSDSKVEVEITKSVNNVSEDDHSTRQGDRKSLVPEPSKQKDAGTLWLVFALRFFLFSPIKWKRNGCWISLFHLVWFAVFIAKTWYLTVMTFEIGNCRETVFSSIEDGYIALHHNLLKHWDASFETLPYPPSTGKFAVYNQEDLRKRINYAVENVLNAEVTATGYFKRFESDSVTINLVYFDLEHDHGFHNFTRIVTNINKNFEPYYGLSKYEDIYGNTLYSYNITEELDMLNISSSLDRMLLFNIMFSLHTLRVSKSYNDFRCQHIYGNVTFDDNNHNGQVNVGLSTYTMPISCSKMNFSQKDSPQCRGYTGYVDKRVKFLSWTTVIGDALLFIGGIYTLYRTYLYMKVNYHHIYGGSCEEDNLPWSEYLCNIKWWYITSIIGDVFTLMGVVWIASTLGEEDNDFKQPLKEWDKNVVYIGSGCLLTWFSMLRFIKINHKFTLLFKTLQRSAVDVLFFLSCVTIIFVGFLFCIYVVLGPYNIKKSYEQEEEEETKDIPKTLAYFMCKDFEENANCGRYYSASLDEKSSLLRHRCGKENNDRCCFCTCGVFNTLVHFLCCHTFTICCCHCKATSK
ncbi:mucolipin-1-like isoform X2 [Ruditapes philippinarum]|uniref:mucolipin-1-like isoform X2 n=1 Tax=Ruditapes philippinarum TaxID=129788 RepID=UPI00295B99F8|nr:mucolipin-1-like isoform X2 [Ruditapes philippinarum]